MSTDLIPTKKIDPIQVFTGGGLDAILAHVEQRAMDHDRDISTAAKRKAITSMAYKVSQSKTYLDGLGKDLVADWKAKSKAVDEGRKKARNFLDALRDEVRRPVTEWEEAEKARQEADRLSAEIDKAWDDAHAEHELFLRQKAIEEKEAEIARAEAEKRAAEEAERAEKEKAEREKRIAEEAAERARIAAEQAAERKRQAELEAERRRHQEAEQARIAEIERMKAEQAAKDRAEAARLEEERRRAADIEHRRKINQEALAAIVAEGGVDDETGIKILTAIVNGDIPNVVIQY